MISSTFVAITEKEMLLPNCKLNAGHNTHQNGMYIGKSILKNHYCQYMDTLKHSRVYKTLPRILQQISDENRGLDKVGVILKHGFFNEEYQKMQK